ncbi:LptA/OstA family protein [Notoacmeibacter sp. MSK16QG-6]|uniref:LptA/OstA family protein n=1 Tax=Notoacmeibacter sp. MSK16QG-6 TaxID=2957982 RepID=UPI0020A125AB|nr:LptA/OstA family protein [Notoacmeibacter sp. MSK16QG-6]MCP1198891.1 LPS ABC transporter substrate-binding protein LptA [Notoacmeibacter sp. MSK16QG-6]
MDKSVRANVRNGCLAIAIMAMMTAPAIAQQQSQDTNFKLEGGQPIQIESDQLEVFDKENTAVFTGNVSVTQKQTQMRSSFMKVFYTDSEKASASNAGSEPSSTAGQSSSDIERIEVGGKVYVNSGTQTATGDEGSFDMKSNVLRLTGKQVVLSDGDNVLTGCVLTVQTETGRAKLDPCRGSRVRMVISPDSQ